MGDEVNIQPNVRVMSKVQLKEKVNQVVETYEDTFTTRDIMNEIKPFTSNKMSIEPNRLQQYIRQTGKASFDKSRKEWVKLSPETMRTQENDRGRK